jgi:formylglycine-generating enzyme required for sulfatase activity
MTTLIAALASDPVAKLRKQFLVGGTAIVLATALIGAWQMGTRRRAESERQIAGYLEEGRRAATAARAKTADARDLRKRALAAFDAMDRDKGEALWRQTRALFPAIDGNYDKAERDFDAARMLDPLRKEVRAELADLRYEHFLFAEDFRLETRARVLEERLTSGDGESGKRKLLASPGLFVLRTTPAAATIVLERYERDPVTGRRSTKLLAPPTQAPMPLAPGSYRISLDGPGLAHVVYPFEVGRGEKLVVELSLPQASAVPDGFAYVPPGEFWFGDADEQLRTQFLGTVPIHRRRTDAYLIARHETTYGDWMQFLDALPPAERARFEPDATSTSRGSLRLRKLASGSWQFTLQPTTRRYVAESGEPIVYEGRKQGARQDWSRFPVAGVSPVDANRYISWLRATGRLPGARLCGELEWERAARGADDRLFPHGDSLADDDANFDVTYGRLGSSYGPDVVGSHGISRSPFDIDDLAGNAFELALSSQEPTGYVIRGGAYYFNSISSRSTNREPVPPNVRDVTTGLRLCSSVRGDK